MAESGKPAYKAYRTDTHRTCTPSATLARIAPLAAAAGITRVANVTGLDRIGLPVFMVCRPNARSIAVSQGKGLDSTAARVSGLMEAIELYHAETITRALKLASERELRADHELIDMARLPRSRYGAYDECLRLLWVEGRELSADGCSCWLPYELVSADYTLPLPPGSGCFAATTNGLASGNHWLEAVCHGLCEVIERDATTLWLLRAAGARGVTELDLDSVDDPACRRALALYEQAGIEVRVWETTSDIAVAAFYCLILDRRSDTTQPEYGAGCHPAREVALLRALTEAAQVRATYIAGVRDDLAAAQYGATADALRAHHYDELLTVSRPLRRFSQVPTFTGDSFDEDLAWLLARLRAAGVGPPVALDLGKAAFDVAVARVVVPGLEGPYEGPGSDYLPGARAEAGESR